MPDISICINVDTRGQKDEQTGLFGGVINSDFLTDSIFNKISFFKGFDIETVVFIDEHHPVDEKTLSYLRSICDTVVIRKHTTEEKFNDWNYWAALAMCRGRYIAHFDQDTAAFTSGKESVQELVDMLETVSYVSYPSHWSPVAVNDPSYDYSWCSTRTFFCKRETLDFTEIKKCLEDMDYLYSRYPASIKNPWFEHICGLHAKYNGKGVYYPPIDYNKLCIWTWGRYETYTMRRLNELPYSEVVNFVQSKGGIQYVNDVYC